MSVFEYFDEVYEIERTQKLLLQSLILPTPRDEECFSRWLAEVDLDAIDFNTMRLIPAVFRKFGHSTDENPHRGRMKGIYRYYFWRNSYLIRAGRRIMEKMRDAGIDFLVFKGIALALKYHTDTTARPMGDIDVLVHRENVSKSEEILHQCGFKYGYPEDKKTMDVHSYDYINANYCGFDLHWYSLSESPRDGIDNGIWGRAKVFDWSGLAVRVMSPEDLLLTSIINGVRDNPKHLHWIYDVASIVLSEPVIQWDTLWGEAGKRDLRQQVFDALTRIRGLATEIIPEALLQSLLSDDPEFYRAFLSEAISEGRTHALSGAKKVEIESVLHGGGGASPNMGNGGAYDAAANAPDAVRHVRYFLNEDLAIDGLFLQWRNLRFVAELFEVRDLEVLHEIVAGCPSSGEGYVKISPGLLSTKLKPRLSTYCGRVVVVEAPERLVLKPGETSEIGVEVENNSPYCWPVCAESGALFGVAYHLVSEDGKIFAWNTPSSYFVKPRANYVAFIEPSQMLNCKLKITAPRKPGRYFVQLDLVHEQLQWFSERGVQFPRFEMEVIGHRPFDQYTVSGSHVVHETIDDETFIVDTAMGTYYTANGYASMIWNAILDGHGAARIISAAAAAGIFLEEDKVVRQFIGSLLAEQLIVPLKTGGTEPRSDPIIEKVFGWDAIPVLTRFPEPRERAAVVPVRGARAQESWPHPPAASDCTDGPESRG